MLGTIINCSLIFIGAFIMLFSVAKSRRILKTMPLIPKRLRDNIAQLLSLHRLLMCFFLIGYVVVLANIALQFIALGNAIVSVIFLFGAIFVYMGIAIEVRLLSEIQKTLGDLLPICVKCKKVREPNADGKDPKSWTSIEAYISQSGINFTHGYCPECYKETIEEWKKENPNKSAKLAK